MGELENQLIIDVKDDGQIIVDLMADLAPNHVARVKELTRSGFYDGRPFHRVIEGFMAQTGDVQFGKVGDNIAMAGRGGSELPDLPAEFSNIPFDRGIVGMARAQNPNSANSQFFIMFKEGYFLNGQYTVVGKVVEGMEIVDTIKLGLGSNGAVLGAPDFMEKVSSMDQ